MSDNYISIDRTAAKKYFRGVGLAPWLLILIGIPFILAVIGIFMIIVGVIWIFIVNGNAAAYESEVDKIIQYEQDSLMKRGAEKLNLIEQQTELVKPIRVIGPSYQPEITTKGKQSIFGLFRNFKKITENAPIFHKKIGSDGLFRFSLIETNIFIFGETELYIYFAHLDITTGQIFHEGTHEYFYKDICGITTDQIIENAFDMKNRKFESKLVEFVEINTYGCSHKAAFDSSVNNTNLDEQFTAMRNLIRDKKEE